MFHLLAMLALSIANVVFLILFIRWSRLQEQNLNAILEEYKLLKKSTELYILSSKDTQKFKEFDDYFDKVFKSLQESKKSIMERVNETNAKHNEDKKIDGAYTEQGEPISMTNEEAVNDNQGMEA